MKYIFPDYYGEFRCIAGACRHTCCRDWDIEIDDNTLARYRGTEGDLGRRLRESIYENDEGAHFRFREDGRCPFLNDEGLCDLIIGLGEDSLCSICAEHPRFYNDFGDRVEAGLGMSCEAAARLILTREAPVRLVEEEVDDEPDMECGDSAMADEVMAVRGRLMAIAQDRSRPVSERVERMLRAEGARLPVWDNAVRAEMLMELEYMHDEWHDALRRLSTARPRKLYRAELELPLEQLLCYLLYRHMPLIAKNETPKAVTRFVAFSWKLVRDVCIAGGDCSVEALIDTARMFSEEIEYSDENPFIIIGELSGEGEYMD